MGQLYFVLERVLYTIWTISRLPMFVVAEWIHYVLTIQKHPSNLSHISTWQSLNWSYIAVNVQCIFTVQYIKCIVYNIQCTLYIVHCTLYIVPCTLYIGQCTMYTKSACFVLINIFTGVCRLICTRYHGNTLSHSWEPLMEIRLQLRGQEYILLLTTGAI